MPAQNITIQIPSSNEPKFCNLARVTVQDDAVVLQFAYVRPNTAQGQLLSEIVLSPKQAINFNQTLDKTIKKHFTKHLS